MSSSNPLEARPSGSAAQALVNRRQMVPVKLKNLFERTELSTEQHDELRKRLLAELFRRIPMWLIALFVAATFVIIFSLRSHARTLSDPLILWMAVLLASAFAPYLWFRRQMNRLSSLETIEVKRVHLLICVWVSSMTPLEQSG